MKGEEVPARDERPAVLFICTHNAARSQMAEGMLRHLFGDRYRPASAGTHPGRVHPMAVAVMAELGADLSGHRSKSLPEVASSGWDTVVTVCDNARESCPVPPGARRTLHWSLPDPAAVGGGEEPSRRAFLAVRDEIRRRIEATFGEDVSPDYP